MHESENLTPGEEHLIRDLYGALDAARSRAQKRERTLAEQRRVLDLLNAELDALRSSTSWRVSAPLRLLADVVKATLRRGYSFMRRRVGRGGQRMRRMVSWRRGSRGRVRVAVTSHALEQEYQHKALSEIADTFVLYRIIGNDLVPRHKRGQSRENVEFILDHEPDLPDCEKRWVVNRIVDPEEETAIVALLERHRQSYVHVPFEWSEYCRTDWDLDSFPFYGYCLSEEFDTLPPERRQRALVHAYRHKNNYVMNNNGARNAALREGRDLAKWVLPWDGNCFVTQTAWEEIRTAVVAEPHMKYFTVPMARVGDNRLLTAGEFQPNAGEEPQLIFRRDATEEFNPDLPYGRRPKVELLWRLGVPGPWEEWGDEPWDLAFGEPSADAGAFSQAGWVVRLGSGVSRLEEATRSGNRSRARARDEAIVAALRKLDGRCLVRHQTEPTGPLVYRTSLLDAWRTYVEESDTAAVAVANLKYRAEFAHNASNTAERSIGRGSAELAVTQACDSFDDTVLLSLAAYVTGREDLAKEAVLRARGTVDGASSRMVGPRSGADEAGFAATGLEGMSHFLDAIRTLDGLGVLERNDKEFISARVTEQLASVVEGPEAQAMASAPGHHGIGYDLEVAAMAAYVDDHDTLSATLRRSHERLLGHVSPEGPGPLLASDGVGALCRALVRWVSLTDFFAGYGQQLWAFTGNDGRGLETAIRSVMDRTAAASEPGVGIDRVFLPSRRFLLALAYADYYGLDEETFARWRLTDAQGQTTVGPRLDLDGELPPFWYLCRASALFGCNSTPSPLALGATREHETGTISG